MVDFVPFYMLFIVENVFSITGMGLVLTPGPRNHNVRVGTKIRLVRPDGIVFHAAIRGIIFETRDISIGQEWTKADVPIGTEVWLAE
jgi:hypothetical protein